MLLAFFFCSIAVDWVSIIVEYCVVVRVLYLDFPVDHGWLSWLRGEIVIRGHGVRLPAAMYLIFPGIGN